MLDALGQTWDFAETDGTEAISPVPASAARCSLRRDPRLRLRRSLFHNKWNILPMNASARRGQR